MSMTTSLVDRAATLTVASGRTRLPSSHWERPALPKLTATALAAVLISGCKQLPLHHGRKARQVLRRARGGQQKLQTRKNGVVSPEYMEYTVLQIAETIGTEEHLKSDLRLERSSADADLAGRLAYLPKSGKVSKKSEQTVPIPLKARKLSSSIEEVKKMMRGEIKEENFSGLSTGFRCMDALYRPVRGELTVVTAPPGSGKSEWLLSLLINMAKVHEWNIGACMFEHKRDELCRTLLEKYLVTPYTKMKELKADQVNDAWSFLDRHVCLIGQEFSEELSIDDILDAARHYVEERKENGGLHGLIIDPYNYITRNFSSTSSETNFVAHILRKVKQFAADCNCHVWIVVHPTKGSNTAKGDEPSLYDCCGSANWYNMCDNGIVLQRNKDPNAGSMRMVKVHVAKVRNRFAGEVGQAVLYFDRPTRCYSETAPEAS